MRFDDMLATVLAQPLTNAAARVAAWRQVVDLLGQRRSVPGDSAADRAYDLLRAVRGEVPAAVRAEAARALAGRRLPAPLVALFAEEPAAIMAPLVARARLAEREWVELVPFLPPVARGVLRNRRDLGPAVTRALASFGTTDFTLRAPDGPVVATAGEPVAAGEASAPAGDARIGDLTARIETFRQVAPAPEPAPASVPAGGDGDAALAFRFETGAEGLIDWVDAGPRGALIGIGLAAAAERSDHGVDGQAAGAYRQRAPFRDARLSVAGTSPVAGEWRMSAVPVFDAADGHFTGYRGAARRPRIDETMVPSARGAGLLNDVGMPPDSLRQLVHELRTPLNAIVGFAEMIERQLLGPVARGYRDSAAEIIAQGRRLLATVDDLDLSARLDSHRIGLDPVGVDPVLLLARLQPDYERIADGRGVALAVTIAGATPAVDADPAALERMFARLLAAAVGLAERGERIEVRLGGGDGDDRAVALRITRPRLIAERDEHALLDPGYSPDGDFPDAPVLGLGFALRLIRNLAAAAHGALDIETDAFVLRLPARSDGALSGNRSG